MNKKISGVYTWLILWRAAKAVEGVAVRQIEEMDFCLSDFAVLEVLLHKGPLPVNEIGRRILLTSGSITVAVDRLEKGGWVKREADPEDRRVRWVRLTGKGQRWIKKAFERHSERMEGILDLLSEEDRQTLIELLKKVGKQAERMG